MSLSAGQYYANPRNQFWRLIGSVVDQPLLHERPYPDRLDALKAAGVGLWDVIRSANRAGSLDTSIRDHEAHALAEFAATLPHLRAIAFNGGTASAIGRKQLGEDGGHTLITLPSSSPAYTMAFERKREAWLQLKPLLAAT